MLPVGPRLRLHRHGSSMLFPWIITLVFLVSKTRRLETERRYARERYDRILHQVLELEDHMGITKRWTPATPEYTETVRYISERRYHQALNNLQQLVTQRLFELHRLNLSGVGRSPSPLIVFL